MYQNDRAYQGQIEGRANQTKKGRFGKPMYFITDSKYYTISIYTVITVLICAVIVRAIFMWESTSTGIHALLNWASPYLFGIFLACLLYPMVCFFEKYAKRILPEPYSHRFGRGISILLTYLTFLGVIILVIGVILPQVWQSVLDLAVVVPYWYRKSIGMLEYWNASTPELDFAFITKKLEEIGTSFFTGASVQQQLQDIVTTVVSTSVSVVSLCLNLIIALIVSVYLLIDLKRIGRTARKVLNAFVPESTTQKIAEISSESYAIFSSFVSGKMIDSLIIGVLCFIAMNLLKLPYALVISVVVGVTNMIPYFGPFIGAVPGAFILLMVSPIKMLIYLVLILILQQFDGLYLGPKILGDSTGLRPAWIIFSVSAGGAIAGVLGMFIGVPVVAVIGHLINIWIEYRLKKKQAIAEEIEASTVMGNMESADTVSEKVID